MAIAGSMSINPSSHQSTSFINLMRSGKFRTHLGWAPLGAVNPNGPKPVPEMTHDYMALICSLNGEQFAMDLDAEGNDVPFKIKAGQKLDVTLDCTVKPARNWMLVVPSPQLAELFVVSGATHYPAKWEGSPGFTLVAKRNMLASDIPLVAAYIMLIS